MQYDHSILVGFQVVYEAKHQCSKKPVPCLATSLSGWFAWRYREACADDMVSGLAQPRHFAAAVAGAISALLRTQPLGRMAAARTDMTQAS
jgi:hypothetical protein